MNTKYTGNVNIIVYYFVLQRKPSNKQTDKSKANVEISSENNDDVLAIYKALEKRALSEGVTVSFITP